MKQQPKLAATIGARVEQALKDRLDRARKTLDRSESYAVRQSVIHYLPTLEKEARAARSRRSR